MARTPDRSPTPGRPGRADRWLVDGMNVIGTRPDGWWNNPDRAVRRFIEELDRYGAATGDDITAVFDRRPPDLSAGRHGAITVAFATRRGRNAADHDIVEVVAGDATPESIRVVTSDRRLSERVQELGARVTSASSFLRRITGTRDADRPPEP